MTEPASPRSGWRLLAKSILTRTFAPFRQPTYIFFFLVCMLAGAIGIWAAIIEAWLALDDDWSLHAVLFDEGSFKAIVTFFVALGSASCAKIVMTEDKEKHLRGYFTFLLFSFVVIAVAAFFLRYQDPADGMPLAIFGTVLAMFTWWIANWDDHSYEQVREIATLGGSPGKEAAGDTEGFKV